MLILALPIIDHIGKLNLLNQEQLYVCFEEQLYCTVAIFYKLAHSIYLFSFTEISHALVLRTVT